MTETNRTSVTVRDVNDSAHVVYASRLAGHMIGESLHYKLPKGVEKNLRQAEALISEIEKRASELNESLGDRVSRVLKTIRTAEE